MVLSLKASSHPTALPALITAPSAQPTHSALNVPPTTPSSMAPASVAQSNIALNAAELMSAASACQPLPPCRSQTTAVSAPLITPSSPLTTLRHVDVPPVSVTMVMVVSTTAVLITALDAELAAMSVLSAPPTSSLTQAAVSPDAVLLVAADATQAVPASLVPMEVFPTLMVLSASSAQ